MYVCMYVSNVYIYNYIYICMYIYICIYICMYYMANLWGGESMEDSQSSSWL